MGNIGVPEIIVILIIGLLLFGAKKLPEIGKSLGKGIKEFKKASSDIKNEIESEIDSTDSNTNLDNTNNTNNTNNIDDDSREKLISFIKNRNDITDEQKQQMISDLEKNEKQKS